MKTYRLCLPVWHSAGVKITYSLEQKTRSHRSVHGRASPYVSTLSHNNLCH